MDGYPVVYAYGDTAEDREMLDLAHRTLLIEFRDRPVAETRDLDENTILDVDADGNNCSITVEHASTRTDIPQFSYEQVTT